MRFLILGLATLLGACSSSNSPDRYRCSIRLGSALDRCIESTEVTAALQATVESRCKTRGGTLEPVQICTATDRLGGCRKQDEGYTEVEWFYSTGTVTSASQAEAACMGRTPLDSAGRRIFGGDAGAQVTNDAGGLVGIDGGTACSVMGGTPMTVTFHNKSTVEVSGYFVDFDCLEHLYFTLAAGGSLSQLTSGGHIWRFRVGSADPAGLLIKEYLADPLTPTVDIP